MSENVNKPADGGQAPDMTKYVPKEDYEKLSGSVKDLETKLEEAKLSLLDPEFIDFRESKKLKSTAKKAADAATDLSDVDLSKLSPKQLLAAAVDRAKEAVMNEIIPEYEEKLRAQAQTLSDVLAVLELQEVEKKHSDFGNYKDATRKVLETSSTPLTIEQAYLLAKASNPQAAAAAAPAGSERPSGTVPLSSDTTKTFKDKNEAGLDAWDRVVGAGKDYL